jgi:hypothetical protein
MTANHFVDLATGDVTAFLEWPLASVIDFIERGMVRAAMLLRAQCPDARVQIDKKIKSELAAHASEGLLRVPMLAIVVCGART